MKRIFSISLAVLAAVCLFRAAQLLNTAHAQEGRGPVIHTTNPDNQPDNGPETNRGNARVGEALTTGSTATRTPVITYHGGPVIGTPKVYIIWYGNWNQGNGSDTPAGQQIVRDFVNSVSNSSYFQINTTYSGVSGSVSVGSETTDTGSQGTRLTDNKVLAVVNNAVTSGALPYDANGVYFVLTSSNIAESSGFCSRYCGWHTAGSSNRGHVRYSFVGNANRCLSACAAQTNSPNSNAGVDGAISVMTHELEEATTDPDLNAWYDSQGAEDADKCAWTFGHHQFQVSNGSWANVTLGARNYLIQRELQQITGGDLCKMSLASGDN
jgi:Phosphate-induced protein 1 conserved region